MRTRAGAVLAFLAAFFVLSLLHLPLLGLPYFWDEAGYYVPAALDFYHSGLLIPSLTSPAGHPPLISVYLGIAWRFCGYDPLITRLAMTLIATTTIATLYKLGRRVANPEVAAWSIILLALSPLFFAQSTLVHLDLAAALFTTLAIYFLLEDRFWLFALAASLAVLSKETAVVLMPVAWLYTWHITRSSTGGWRNSFWRWSALATPLVPLVAWTVYYHHATGFWTGNREYLRYNLYSTLSATRIFWSLLRRLYELLFSGFNWLLTVGALVGFWRSRRRKGNPAVVAEKPLWRAVTLCVHHESRVGTPALQFMFLAAGLGLIYLLLLSVVGGAVLPRYLLPILPCFYLIAVTMVTRLPRFPARLICTTAAACFVGAWFINPPYPFPFEDNLAYADYIRLHQQAAQCLESMPGDPRILTAWPATDEIERPFLGYVRKPLRPVPVQGFTPQEFANVPEQSFDILYLYTRKWEPPGNWVARFPEWLQMQARYFDYRPQINAEDLVARYHLQLREQFERRGQWVRIYSRRKAEGSRQ
jgi:4-amino-4-deoxy-L-arabinose transferase-like glycosyltransferase